MILYSLLSCKGKEQEQILLPMGGGERKEVYHKVSSSVIDQDTSSGRALFIHPDDSSYLPLQDRPTMLNYGKDVK